MLFGINWKAWLTAAVAAWFMFFGGGCDTLQRAKDAKASFTYDGGLIVIDLQEILDDIEPDPEPDETPEG